MRDDSSGTGVTGAVRKWLDGHGYPHEMAVAQRFRQHRFSVEQSQYYEDPETEGRWREIDIVATQTDWDTRSSPALNRPEVLVQIGFVAECKRSRDPWVVFTHQTKEFRNRPCQLRACNHRSTQAVLALEKRQNVTAMPLFDPLSSHIGYGVTAMKGKDSAYEALFQAAKAATALVSYVYGLPENLPWFRLFFPMVVLDGPLTRAWLGDDGTVQVEETERTSVVIRYPGIRHTQLCVEIVTMSGLDAFLKEADEASRLIAALCLTDFVDEIKGSVAE